MATSKIITPIILCWLAISEAGVGFISIRAEFYLVTTCQVMSSFKNAFHHESAYVADVCQ